MLGVLDMRARHHDKRPAHRRVRIPLLIGDSWRADPGWRAAGKQELKPQIRIGQPLRRAGTVEPAPCLTVEGDGPGDLGWELTYGGDIARKRRPTPALATECDTDHGLGLLAISLLQPHLLPRRELLQYAEVDLRRHGPRGSEGEPDDEKCGCSRSDHFSCSAHSPFQSGGGGSISRRWTRARKTRLGPSSGIASSALSKAAAAERQLRAR